MRNLLKRMGSDQSFLGSYALMPLFVETCGRMGEQVMEPLNAR